MKKLIAFVLVLASSFALFSCGASKDAIKSVNKMYRAMVPTKIVTETTQDIGSHVLTGEYIIATGTIDGKDVSTLSYKYQQLRSVEDGAGKTEELPWEDISLTKEYHEDKGLRENGGKWQADGEDFAPTIDDVAMKFEEKYLSDIVVDEAKKTVTFVVSKDNTVAVFGEDMAPAADVTVVITHDGAAIMSFTMTYTVAAESKNHPDIVTTIKTVYSYEPQEITLD